MSQLCNKSWCGLEMRVGEAYDARMTIVNEDSATNLPLDFIQEKIVVIRGVKVMLDAEIAALYGVPTGHLIQAVKRNLSRFPDDFMFQINAHEFGSLISQAVISNSKIPAQGQNLKSQSVISSGWGGRRTLPRAFTEQGVAMLSSVLSSERAVQINIEIVRAFVALGRLLSDHERFQLQIEHLKTAVDSLGKSVTSHDEQLRLIYQAIQELSNPAPIPPKRQVGFLSPDEE